MKDNGSDILYSYLQLHPCNGNEFTLIPFQGKVECSQDCIRFVYFLVEKAGGAQKFPMSQGIQAWVRMGLEKYAALFVRTLTAIPPEMIPLASHLQNIDRQIDGRLVAVDFKTDQAVFKLDDTSMKKLEVFYAELTGQNPDFNLTQKLDELRIRIGMPSVMKPVLLEFHEIVGKIFDIDCENSPGQLGTDPNGPSVSLEEPKEKIVVSMEAQEDWDMLCRPIRLQLENLFSPTQLQQGDLFPTREVVGNAPDESQLKPPDTVDLSPEPEPTIAPEDCSEQTEKLAIGAQPDVEDITSVSTLNNTMEHPNNKPPKADGTLEHNKQVDTISIPNTPSLATMVDPPPPPVLNLPHPVVVHPLLDPRIRGNFSEPSLTCTTNMAQKFSMDSIEIADNQEESSSSPNSFFGNPDTPSGQSDSSKSSVYDASPTSTNSSPNASNPPSVDPSEIMFSPCSPLRANTGSTLDLQESTVRSRRQKRRQKISIRKDHDNEVGKLEKMLNNYQTPPPTPIDEYGFELEDEYGHATLITKTDREMDLAERIIQGKMEAMLDFAQSEGRVFRATRDGVDNHPISVRIRSISGHHYSMKENQGDKACNLVVKTANTEGNRDGVPFYGMWKSQDHPLMGESNTAKTLTGITPPYPRTTEISPGASPIAGASRASIQNLTKQESAASIDTTNLRALRNKFYDEGRQVLGTLLQTMDRIRVLDEQILRNEALDTQMFEDKVQEVVNFFGNDESSITPGNAEVNNTQESSVKDGTAQGTNEADLPIEENNMGHLNDGVESIMSAKGVPLAVRTEFTEERSHPIEVSPCCQLGTVCEDGQSQGPNIRCAHGMLRMARPVYRPTTFVPTPNSTFNPWKSNYTVVGKNRMRGAGLDTGTRITASGPWEALRGPSFSATDMTKGFGQVLPGAAGYGYNPFKQGIWTSQPVMDKHASVRRNYVEKLTKYYEKTRGEGFESGTNTGGESSLERKRSAKKENVSGQHGKNWEELSEMGLWYGQ